MEEYEPDFSQFLQELLTFSNMPSDLRSDYLFREGYPNMHPKTSKDTVNPIKIVLAFVTFIIFDYHYNFNSNLNGCGVFAASTVRGHDWKDVLLTINERDKLVLFRERVKDKLPEVYMHTDFYLIRWLRARNYNIDNAETMLLENLRWREQNGISNIINENFSDVREDYPVTADSHDKQERPLGTVDFGSWDIRSGILQGKLARILRVMDYLQEKLVQQIIQARESGKEVARAVVLVDLKGFNLLQHACPSCIHVFFRMVVGMESHYPGFWEEIIVVNAPSLFRLLVDPVKGILSPQTGETLTIFDTNKRKWMPYLDDRIEKDQRNENYGGTKRL